MRSRARAYLMRYGALRCWKNAHWRLITSVTEWNTQIDFLKAHGRNIDVKRADAPEWDTPFSFRIDKEYKPYYVHLFFSDENGDLNVWKINSIQPTKTAGQGRTANKVFKSVFEKYNNVSERKAFGYCDRAVISKCVPKQLYYINNGLKNKNLKHISKADFSSHYPANLCGIMPHWSEKENKVISGTVAPSVEYPFAYYIKSGHFAEYGRVDTHKWLDTPLWFNLFGDNYDPKINPEDDITILCKASKYNYDATVTEIYEKKQAGEVIEGVPAKIILNAAIGYKHLKNKKALQNRLDHVAVVCLARANQKMLELFTRDRVIMIVVDSIIYKGSDEIGLKSKKLGKLYQEITDADFRMRGTNQYIFAKDGEVIDYSHSGFDDNIIIDSLESIDKWQKKDIIKIGS